MRAAPPHHHPRPPIILTLPPPGPMKPRIAAVTLALLATSLASGCEGAPGLPRASRPDGTVRFTYSGARTGTYSVAGAADGVSTSYAYAYPAPDPGWTIVSTTWAAQDGSSISLAFGFPTPSGAKTVDFDWRTCLQDMPCPGGVVFFFPPQTALHAAYGYARGTIRITSVSGGRMRGTFSGEGTRESGSGTEALTLADGVFDVPVLDQR